MYKCVDFKVILQTSQLLHKQKPSYLETQKYQDDFNFPRKNTPKLHLGIHILFQYLFKYLLLLKDQVTVYVIEICTPYIIFKTLLVSLLQNTYNGLLEFDLYSTSSEIVFRSSQRSPIQEMPIIHFFFQFKSNQQTLLNIGDQYPTQY